MYWEGFFRSLQGDFMTVFGILIVAGILYLLLRCIINYVEFEGKEEPIRIILKKGMKLVLAVVLGIFLIRALTVAFVDRMPRRDVNKEDVYRQMDSHTRDPQEHN